MKPSFKKVLRDVLSNKSRSFIVLMAIVLGAFGVSMLSVSYNLLGKNLSNNYLKTNPASFTIVVDSISDEVLQQAKVRPNIEYVESRNRITARIEIGPNEYTPIWLFVVDDFKNLKINTFRLIEGSIPESGNEVLIERTGNRVIDLSVNKQYSIVVPSFGKTKLKITGITHDPGMAPSWMEGFLYGYVSHDFVKQMNITGLQPELKFTIKTNKYELQSIEAQLSKTIGFLKIKGIKVIRTEILKPGQHIHQSQMDSLMFLLQMFGVLALILSCFLIINMIMAIMAKETRQIGVMKAIGASTGKITSIYLGIVLIFGVVATLIALPVGYFTGKAYANFVASMLNFELFDLSVSYRIWLFQIAIGTILPVLVAFYPIFLASRISVHEALNDYGVNDNVSLSSTHSTRLLNRWKLSNASLFAIRNTFRRKGRLVLTLITLVMGGAVFISAFNIRASLTDTVNSKYSSQHYEIQTFFAKGVNETDFRSAIESLPLISGFETWGAGKATRLVAGKSESELMEVRLAPLQTKLFVPEIMQGSWLSGNDDEVVVNHMFLSKYPEVKVGDSLTLKMKDMVKTFKIVGSIRELFSPVTVFVSKSLLAELPEMAGKTNSTLIAFNTKAYPNIVDNTSKLEQWFQLKKYPVSLVFRKDLYKERVVDHLVIITTMLIMVTLLLIIVGGLGLITTMGINIVERLRELAILRAIGVTNRKIYSLTITEGFIIGLMSWVLALIVSIPLSYYLGNKFFHIFFETTLNFNISYTGIVLWLVIIVVFSAVAVMVPARNANKQIVAEGLSYE